MSADTSPVEDNAPNAIFPHRENSPTAASAYNPLYGKTGTIVYDVLVHSGAGFVKEQVSAESGDDAATMALNKHFGGKVVSVNPADQQPRRKAA